MDDKLFCVISHTHWDREWYFPLEVFRYKLVDLIDRCLPAGKSEKRTEVQKPACP